MEGENELGQDENKIREDYESVCSKLNMDQESMDSAWKSYTDIRDYYTLEGNHLEWLGCALYVAGQSLQLETVEGETLKGNSVSLTQILRATKLNLIEFFKKMKKWQEMAQLPLSFQQKIEALERKFEVASIIYEKYRKVFRQLFNVSDDKAEVSMPSRHRGRKPHHKKPCSAHDMFRFGWTLYIHIKSKYPLINDDLVNSHHLLLCCVDMLYSASYTKRSDLLNPDSPIKMVEEELDEEGQGGDPTEVSVLGQLCEKFNGIEKECRVIRDYHWNDRMKNLFATKILSAGSGAVRSSTGLPDSSHFLYVLSPSLFQTNEKNLNRDYEMSVLEEGDFDERVFLHPSANEEIGTPLAVGAHNFLHSLSAHTPPQHVQYGTPLLGREHLGTRDHRLTPASEATHHVSQLHVLLEGCRPEPSEYVRKLCDSCTANPLPELEGTVREMGEKLVKESPSDGDEPSNFAKKRLHLSVSLYYKLLDAIMRDEEKKNQDLASLQNILEYGLFHKSLYSLCVEIVLFSYNSQSRTFPWVLEVFEISAYHFYKLIEVAIKLESSFPRGIIKHLNRVEEMVLSQLAWMSDSPLFDAIDAAGSVPPYRDVALPSQTGVGRGLCSSLPHPRLTKLGARVPDSPLSALQSRHMAAGSPSSSARRALFSPGSSSTRKSLVPIAPKPPQGGGTGGGAGGVTVQLITDVIKKMQQTTPTNSPSKDQADVGSGDSGTSPAKSTVPIITPSATFLGSSSSPVKALNLIGPELLQSAASTVLSPSSKGLPLSPSGVRPLIPTPPPIPSVTVTPTLSGSKIGMTTPNSASPRPKRTGSLALFYRKMYQLASIRIKDLCERLNVPQDFVQKVWTCFEHCMVKSPDILRDRHIDQIIMCSIYILSKALSMEVTFQEMMRQYRHQPQAKSHVYKSVLLNNGPRRSPPPDTSFTDASSSENVPTTTHSDTPRPPTATTPLEELLYRPDIPVGTRGDIIQFYNKVFIGFLKDFVLQFSPADSEAAPSLSPLPVIHKAAPSPRKLSKYQNIFISPHKPSASPSSAASAATSASAALSPLAKPIGKPYIIQKSPNVELTELSKAIRSTKRPLDLTASPFSPSSSLASTSKRLCLSPQIRGASPGGARRANSLFQAMNSIASDRARTVSSSSGSGEQ